MKCTYDNLVKKIELMQDIETAQNQIGAGKGIAHGAARGLLISRVAKKQVAVLTVRHCRQILPEEEID